MSGGPHDHVFEKVAKQKGNRVRYTCSTCPKMGPWIRVNEPEASQPEVDYESFGVTDLRLFAKRRGLHGYSKMKKQDLVTLLEA